jgi:Fic family protein
LRPFNTTQLKNLRAWFRIGFIQNSNAIEGNSSSLSEVKVLLEDGITVGGKTVKEIKETLNHGDVMQSLDNLFTEKHIEITQALVL